MTEPKPKRTRKPGSGGHNKAKIDPGEFEELCALQCTAHEIARVFRTTERSLHRFCVRHYRESFADAFARLRLDGFVSLRRQQWRAALEGDRTLMIWLGKQYLGQVDETRIRFTDVAQLSDEELAEQRKKLGLS